MKLTTFLKATLYLIAGPLWATLIPVGWIAMTGVQGQVSQTFNFNVLSTSTIAFDPEFTDRPPIGSYIAFPNVPFCSLPTWCVGSTQAYFSVDGTFISSSSAFSTGSTDTSCCGAADQVYKPWGLNPRGTFQPGIYTARLTMYFNYYGDLAKAIPAVNTVALAADVLSGSVTVAAVPEPNTVVLAGAGLLTWVLYLSWTPLRARTEKFPVAAYRG